MEQAEQTALVVEKIVDLHMLPSGSGMAIIGDSIFIAGDDSPYLFQLSKAYEVLKKQLVLPQFSDTDRIPKPVKPDFESMVEAEWLGRQSLLIFGSGSKSPERDLLLVVPLEHPRLPQTYSLTALYNKICETEGISRDHLNLEGAVLTGQELWLLNRGRNAVISMPLIEFSGLVQEILPLAQLTLSIYPLDLPQIAGKQARFSGACSIPNSDDVLFTATVEDTDNWIDDGEILGSFIGILHPQGLQQVKISQYWLLTDARGNALPEKLESVDVLEQQENSLKLLTIADNDDGSSRLIEIFLKPFPIRK